MKTLLAMVMALTLVPLLNEHGVLFVRGTIDNSKAVLFVFDPGAGDFVSSAAPKIGKTARIRVGDASVTEALQLFPGDPQSLVPNHDVSLGAIAGSIGPGLLAKYVVRVDYPHSTIAFIAQDRFVAPAGAVALPLAIDAEGLPTVAASADAIAGTFELDLRAPTSALFALFVKANNFSASYAGKPVLKTGGLGPQYALASLGIGSLVVRDVPAWFSTAPNGKFAGGKVAGLIGNNALGRFVVTLDYKTKMAYIERP